MPVNVVKSYNWFGIFGNKVHLTLLFVYYFTGTQSFLTPFFYVNSGGYNIKTGPGCSIELMKFDMGGSAAVLGAAKAIGQIKPSGVEVNYHCYCFSAVGEMHTRPICNVFFLNFQFSTISGHRMD